MMDKKKRAALAAVVHYLAWERACLAQDGLEQEDVSQQQAQAALPDNYVGPWAVSGRQGQMHMRTMMQMKAFR